MGKILTGLKNNDLYVLVEGRGTAEYCSDLNACLQEFLLEGVVKKIYFDMEKSCYVDSSFIGLILCAKKKLGSTEDGVVLLNPSDKIVDIFQIMGLDSFIPMVYDKNLSCDDCSIEVNQKLENSISDIRLLLESHQNIMETSSENHKRFALVEKVFKKELEQKQYNQ